MGLLPPALLAKSYEAQVVNEVWRQFIFVSQEFVFSPFY